MKKKPMAFDGITTACLAKELEDRLTGGRIAKIQQTESDELILTIRLRAEKGGGQVRLFLSANPSLPLCYLTEGSKTAPLTAPSFCMLLRKHLQNGKILSVRQPCLERILRFEAEHMNEMGDMCRFTLIIELMGKHSNIILVDEQEKIVDSIRRISSMVSSVREVLPGRPYFVPETQNKENPREEKRESFLKKISSSKGAASILVRSYMGISGEFSEELCARAGIDGEQESENLTGEEKERLWDCFCALMENISAGDFRPVIYCGRENGRDGAPSRYAAFEMNIFADMPSRNIDSMSRLLETFYEEKNAGSRIRQKSGDLRRIVQTILERNIHKYDLQTRQMEDTGKKDRYRLYGELLNVYGYGLESGLSSCELENYYTGEKVKITLDPTMTPAQNSRRYYDRYTKLKRTGEALTVLMREEEVEIRQLQSIRMALDMATEEGDLEQIRKELEESGFIRKKGPDKKGKARIPASRPLHFVSSDGYHIYVGKNNIQNEQLTFHFAAPTDIWMHANDIPGSHVILRTEGKKMEELPDRVFEEAAAAAAYYSSGREQEKVEIDYLEKRNVRRPSGAKPGFVVYYTNYSILARTDISALSQVE